MPGSVRRIPVRSVRVRQQGDDPTEEPVEEDIEEPQFSDDEDGQVTSTNKVKCIKSSVDDEEDDENGDDDDLDEEGNPKANVSDLFAVGCEPSEQPPEAEAEAESPQADEKSPNKKRRWKNFKTGVRHYSDVMKKKLSRKKRDKNGVEEISIKPDRVLHDSRSDQCWTSETTTSAWSTSDVKKFKRPKSAASLSGSDRTGSAGSNKSHRAGADVDDDGIETIYDAEYQGGL